MESKVDYLERTVENTDRKLENLSWKVEKWERAVSQVSLFEEASPQLESEQEDCVLNLLQDVTQVREDYEQLRSDITEIQQLQRELSECLKSQLHHMHAKYGFLRSKLGPALPSCLMMSTNSYRGSPTKHADRGPILAVIGCNFMFVRRSFAHFWDVPFCYPSHSQTYPCKTYSPPLVFPSTESYNAPKYICMLKNNNSSA